MYKANPRIKDLPKDERPRERLRKYGPESLRDSDLLALILKSGFKGTTAVQLGEQILTAFEGDLKRMADNRLKQFEKIKGVGEAKAAQIVAAFELGKRLARFHADRDKITSPADVADLMMSKMRYLQKEVVCVLCLDTKGGVQGFATRFRYRNEKTGELEGDFLPVDLAANAASLGAKVIEATTLQSLKAALHEAREAAHTTVVKIDVDYYQGVPRYESWWDVPIAQVSEVDSAQEAYEEYESDKQKERYFL